MAQPNALAVVHKPLCKCPRCVCLQLGRWIDALGGQTQSGSWQVFLTLTFAENVTPGFGRCRFEEFIGHLSMQLGSCVEYVLADQYGQRYGRFHQHALLSAAGLNEYPRRGIEDWFRVRTGWSRALPFERGAAYYLARYIGRHLQVAEWTVSVGESSRRCSPQVGKTVVATSALVPKELFHQGFRGRKR